MVMIDTLSDKAKALCIEAGIDPAAFYAVLFLDQNEKGEAGERYLAIDVGAGLLYRIGEKIESFTLSHYKQPRSEAYLSCNRLLATKEGEGGDPFTVSFGFCTNACRGQLFLFLSAWEAYLRGEPLNGEEEIFHKAPPKKEPPQTLGILARIFSYFKPHGATVFLILFLLVIEVAIDLVRPYLSGQILFDRIIAADGENHELGALLLCLSTIVALGFLRYGAIIVRNLIATHMSLRVTQKIRGQLFDSVMDQSYAYFGRQSGSQIAHLIGYDVSHIQQFFGSQTMSLFIYVVEFLVVGVVLFLMNWKLSLLVLVPIPLIVLIYRRAFPLMQRMNNASFRENRAVSAHINNSLDGIRVVKAFAKEEEEGRLLQARMERLYRVTLRSNLLSAVVPMLVTLLIYLTRETVFGLGGSLVMGGSLTYGQFSTYLGYIGMVFAPLQFFSTYTSLVGSTAESARRMIALLDAVPDVRESESPISLPALRGDISFRNVSFHYTENRPVLKKLTFDIKAGEHIGLVGRTGCGKSTLANLIGRMYDVVSGRILIDGVDVRELSFDTLRKNLAIVSQEIFLFQGTVRQNLCFGRQTATDEEVIAAAKLAGAHDFIMAMPHGYDTMIGNGKRLLSGGERQRISIARAILADPAILILDEATAAMDNRTEKIISDALATLSRGKTTLSIAHRLSTLRDCDRIMSMEAGELCEMGTKEELLAKKGIFYKLYTLQNEQMQRVMTGEEETL